MAAYSGHKGVSYHLNRPKPWKARIQDNGKDRHLGYFATKEEAIAAYDAAEASRTLLGKEGRREPRRRDTAIRCYDDERDLEEGVLVELNRGWARVDLADLDQVMFHVWHVSSGGYACRDESGSGRYISMHRTILRLDDDDPRDVDHENGDILDNRRLNLRPATESQNNANRRKTRGTSKYKGVSWDKRRQKWMAYITVCGLRHYLGYFTVEEDAARAYNQAALKAFGSYARLNDVPLRRGYRIG